MNYLSEFSDKFTLDNTMNNVQKSHKHRHKIFVVVSTKKNASNAKSLYSTFAKFTTRIPRLRMFTDCL